MANSTSIIVSYSGVEKRVTLAIQPSLELSDDLVQQAERHLHTAIRELFKVPQDDHFYLHEAESSRIMSRESFREPGYALCFPSHWYLVKPSVIKTKEGPSNSDSNSVERLYNGLQNGSNDDLMTSLGVTTPPSDDTSSEGPSYEDEALLPLSDLTALPDEHYQTTTLTSDPYRDYGLSLRHFTIQSESNQRSDTPLGDYERTTSPDSLDLLKLSTTFIFEVVSGGEAERAGLEVGMVVHMINGASIIRSNGQQIKEVIEQCGDELSLLTLPKEHDDLQFLYPRYTYGQTGDYSSKDGQVTACDIKVTRGTTKGSKVKVDGKQERKLPTTDHVTPVGVAPPSGMMVFNDDASQDNSQSCDPRLPRQQTSHDDILVEGSLLDIENHSSVVPRSVSSDGGGSLKQLNQLEHSGHYRNPRQNSSGAIDFTPGELDLINEGAPVVNSTNEWYNDSDENFSLGQDMSVSDQIVMETSTSDTNFLSMTQPLLAKVRTRSNSSLEARTQAFLKHSQGNSSLSDSTSGRVALTSSMSALDHLSKHSSSYKDRARSTDLGRVRIKKKGNKSLEGLTRIASDGTRQHFTVRTHSAGDSRRLARHESIEHPVKQDEPWTAQSNDFTATSSLPRGMTSSDMSQGSKGQLSNESTGSTNVLHTEPIRSKRSSRGYQAKRSQLHSKSRSKLAMSGSVESDISMPSERGVYRRMSGGRGQHRSPSTSQENEVPTSPPSKPITSPRTPPDIQTPPKVVEQPRQAVSEPKYTIGRKASLKNETPPPIRPRFNRPMSAIEPSLLAGGGQTSNEIPGRMLQVPFASEPSRKIPIFKTRSIGEQIVREVNIEDAIAASQAERGENPSPASQGDRGRVWTGRSHSIDVTLNDSLTGKKRSKRLFGKKQGSVDLLDGPDMPRGLGMVSSIHRLSSEVLTSLGLGQSASQPTQTNIQCHGVLNKKQDLLDSGKRVGDRSWKSFYAVLSSNKLSFYKGRREAHLHASCDEPPIEVVPSKTDFARNYNKKKFVFRVATEQGAVYLLQASDAPSLKNWVNTIQGLNGGPPTPEATLTRSKDSDSKLAPSSPMLGKRSSSPKPKKKDDSGKRFFDKLKNRLTRTKDDETDFSNYVTFGQPLENCPVSIDKKRVPLAIEYCVQTIEDLGIDVEGIYRKPGHVAMIKHMSAEMDKGTYDFTQDEIGDVHTVASLCKKFFKELPDPMIPDAVHDLFLACARMSDEEQRLVRLKELVYDLPTAHYHTLNYLMKHLKKVSAHSEQNKMTFRNVALVFGPTLMRSAAHDLLASMNEGYTIVENLCKHVDHLFQNELCAEEERVLEEAHTPELPDEGATKGSPVVRRRDLESRQQKDVALAKASPQSIRRIKNNIGLQIRSSEPQRNSFIPIEGSLSLQPKQSNWDTPSPANRGVGTNRSIDSGVSSPGDQQRSPDAIKPAAQRARKNRHVYEDVERTKPHYRHAYEDVDGFVEKRTDKVSSRTSSWVNAHSEMGWGKANQQPGRETTGSMWAPKNRDARTPREKRDRRKPQRLSGESISPPGTDRERDLTMTYHEPSRLTRPAVRSGSVPFANQSRVSNTLPTGGGGVQRRVSYVSAMGGPSDDGGARFASSDNFADARVRSDYSSTHRYSKSPAHRQGHARQYDSLQRTAVPPTHTRRRSSESGGERPNLQEMKAHLLRPNVVKPLPTHRTRSHGAPNSTGEGMVRTSSAHHVEPTYLKQSLL